MHARLLTFLSVFLLLPFTDATIHASADPIYIFDGRLIGSVEPGGLHLQIQFDGNAWSVNQWTTTPAGLDVYRQRVGAQCGSWERITEDPVDWTWVDDPGGGPHLAFDIIDDTAEPNNGYMYWARAVDGNRDAVPDDADAYLGVATHGVALLGHGTLYGGAGGCGQNYRQEVWNCNLECFPPLLANTASEVTPYINSGTRVLLYGTITEVTSLFCGTNETVAYFTSAVPGDCIVAAEETTWGRIKDLYRD